jgi:hypothetical protein
VDAQGYPEPSAAGTDTYIDNKFLRETLAPKDKEEQEPLDAEALLDEQYQRAIKDTQRALRVLADEMRNLGDLQDENGVSLIERRGRSEAKLLRGTLQTLLGTAEEWWEAAMDARPTSPGGDADDENGAEGESETDR